MTTPLAEMVRVMLERDVPRDVIVTAIEAAERHAVTVTGHALRHVTNHDAKIKAAERAKRYRDKKKRDEAVTPSRDAPDAHILTSSSLPESQEHSEGKKENKKVRARKSSAVPLPLEWEPKQTHHEAAERLNIPPARMLSKAEDMRLWAKSNDIRKVDWDATFHGFLRRDADQRGPNRPNNPGGNPTSRPPQTGADAIVAGMGRLAARIIERKSATGPDGEVQRSFDAAGGFDADRGPETGDQAALRKTA